MTVIHRPGSKHANADALSRLSVPDPCQEYRLGWSLEQLPCGGCNYCQRAHQRWGSFTEEVDDVVPLSVKRCRQGDVDDHFLEAVPLLFGETSLQDLQVGSEECASHLVPQIQTVTQSCAEPLRGKGRPLQHVPSQK